MIMITNVKVKVINDLSGNEVDLKSIMAFCLNIFSDSNKSHSCDTLINSTSTHMVRVERTPDTPTQIYALFHHESNDLMRWYPVTVTWS